MFIYKKKLDSYIKLIWDLKQENDVLKQQISKLQNENEGTARYRNEYKMLSEQSKDLIERYKHELENMEELEKEYKKYLVLFKKNY